MLLKIKFRTLETWLFPTLRKYQYDFLKDSQIEDMINSKEICEFEVHKFGWLMQTDCTSTKEDNPIHLKIIAKMIIMMREGVEFPPVKINARNYECDIENSGYCVTDGHHRLRAMKYLDKTSFRAEVKGAKEDINHLLNEETL